MYDHIILISLDTLRADAVGANPCRLWPDRYAVDVVPETPCLDELAREGAFFPGCVTAAPYTSAAHASYFTGKWPLRHNVFELFNRKLQSETLFSRAKRQGYHTLFKTDFPVILGPFLGFTRDIDDYLIEDDDAFLQRLTASGPVFAFAHFGGLHIPYGFHNLTYGGRAYRRKVAELEAEIADLPDEPVDQIVETYRDPEDLELMLRYKRVVQYHYARGHYDRLFSLYLEGVDHFLRHRFRPFLARLLEKLRGSRYLLVVFGDHGEEYDRDAYGHHNTLHEGVLRVPLMFYGPDVRPGTHWHRVRSIDLAPTLLECMGDRGGAAGMDGRSLGHTVFDGGSDRDRRAFAQVYTAETADYVRFQRRILRTGRKTGSLKHVLYKEAVYEGHDKLTVQYYTYTQAGGIWGMRPCAPITTLEHVEPGSAPRARRDEARERHLRGLLANYNRLRRRGGRESQVPVPEEVRQHLQAMGYRI